VLSASSREAEWWVAVAAKGASVGTAVVEFEDDEADDEE
tara:strand:- start:107 stop:223 length:117 start_codon:yes stop_codon:yes gene_type:complete